MWGHIVWMALRYLERERIKVITYQTDVGTDMIFTRTHNITFWLLMGLMAFRREKKPLQFNR